MAEIFLISNLGTNILLSILGLAIYTLWSVRNHLGDFKWSIFIGKNKVFWIWVLVAQICYILVFTIIPQLEHAVAVRIADIINGILQTDFVFPDEVVVPVAYLSGAWLLSLIVNRGVKPTNKIGKEKLENGNINPDQNES